MKILAIEFSSEQRSVAIVEKVNQTSRIRGEAQEKGGRNAHAFALIEGALQQAAMEREEIDCIAVGLGPGSYTGIRAAIALAQGWELARNIKILGLSSVHCLAEGAFACGTRGGINVIVDAQRNEFYLARYDLSENGVREIEPLRIATFDEVRSRANEKQIVLGSDATRFFSDGRDLYPEAIILGKIAAEKASYVGGERLEPIYLRETSFVKAPPPRLIPEV